MSDPLAIATEDFSALKDLWVDVGTRTEDEIQDDFCNTVDDFVAGDWKHDRRLQDFDRTMMDHQEYLFADKRYRDLFLDNVHARGGETCKAVVDSAYQFRGAIDADHPFNSKPTAKISRKLAQRQQLRIIYKEVRDSLHHLPTRRPYEYWSRGCSGDAPASIIVSLQNFCEKGQFHSDNTLRALRTLCMGDHEATLPHLRSDFTRWNVR